ncbi:hypothetical protein O9929_23905 [Vibrio lentus]|nr:hypothetical protein [Vibrio lentus]
MNGRPWKFGIEANYYIEKDEKARPDFMLSFNISPVVENKLASLFTINLRVEGKMKKAERSSFGLLCYTLKRFNVNPQQPA